ncbi:MAG: iron-containing alcohol dehydrogenase [Clostridia bacterium]|nr:iron-containing alcohol dehydrogenase [Clostridia bacterium]
MHSLYKLFCRTYQGVFRLAMPLLPYREPRCFDSVDALSGLMAELKPRAALLVTDKFLRQSGMTQGIEDVLQKAQVKCVIFDETQPNPTVKNVEDARKLYVDNGCGCIIALGGGSAMDCAKGVGARIAYPRKTLSQLKGLLRVLRPIPPLIAIPTTAGTGSEVTLAAVLTDHDTRHKYPMNSFTLIPRYAVLDPAFTRSLPPHLTASTGMDALTHAVEAYIGRSTTRETRTLALEAVKLIFENLENAYNNGSDMSARRSMLRAAYAAGIAFSKSYVGYVHAVAHSLGGQYNLPHGLTNAVLLPYVLDAYGSVIHPKLHTLAVAAGIAGEKDDPAAAARAFITAIRDMNRRMGIPVSLQGIRKEDIPMMAAHAAKEANPLYPVPVLMDAGELEALYEKAADWRNEK